MGVMLPFFQLLGSLPHYRDFSNIMERGLATTSASSLRTLGRILSGALDFCMSGCWESLWLREVITSWGANCSYWGFWLQWVRNRQCSTSFGGCRILPSLPLYMRVPCVWSKPNSPSICLSPPPPTWLLR